MHTFRSHRWLDLGGLTVFGRQFGQVFHHPDAPLLSFSSCCRIPRPRLGKEQQPVNVHERIRFESGDGIGNPPTKGSHEGRDPHVGTDHDVPAAGALQQAAQQCSVIVGDMLAPPRKRDRRSAPPQPLRPASIPRNWVSRQEARHRARGRASTPESRCRSPPAADGRSVR